MTVGKWLRSRLYSVALSEQADQYRRGKAETLRRLRRRPHEVFAFLELDDPYSYLLASYLPELERHYDIRLDVRLVDAPGGALRPAPELYHDYALTDCHRLATELGIPFLDRSTTPPVEHRRKLMDALASQQGSPDFKDQVLKAITAYWRGDGEAVASRSSHGGSAANTSAMLDSNRGLLRKLGHYQAAMLYYGGEWYFGVDRLHYLVSRLDALNAARQPGLAPRIASIAQVMRVNLPVSPPAAATSLPALELFYSFRSPYSYIALRRLRLIADAFGIDLTIRPVLPMAMRGLPVPRPKLRYIALDASREARTHGVPFGRFADPLGRGVERCMAVLDLARGEKREFEFLLAAGEAIWSQGVDVASDRGMRVVTERSGLDWNLVEAAMKSDEWRQAAEKNRETMMEAGCWGVPTLRVDDWTTWGQDRDWLVALHLEELCDNGEGILT